MGKVQEARGRARTLFLEPAPQAPAASTEPDDLRRMLDARAECGKPQARLQGVYLSQDGHEPARR
jgi:hypothetical protein